MYNFILFPKDNSFFNCDNIIFLIFILIPPQILRYLYEYYTILCKLQ
nr:MAG TPA: hypothetical protein [Caudoviricetes sp.]